MSILETIINITNIEDLKAVLKTFNIPLETWGKVRTVEHLYSELIAGESYLTNTNNQLTRNLDVICLKIIKDNKVLLQYKQIFVTGEENNTIKLPSEKMLQNESIDTACARLLEEELNITGSFKFTHLKDKQSVEPAYAYPGLTNSLNLHFYETNLPSDVYIKDIYEEITKKQTTYFKWFDQSKLDELSDF